MKTNFLRVLVTMYSFFALTACEHRPLVEREVIPDQRHIRVYLDEHIRNVSYGFYDETKDKPVYHTPSVLRVVLSDLNMGSVKAEAFLTDAGKDSCGYYLEGKITARPGSYRLMAYNFDTESVHIANEYNYAAMYAYTNPIAEEISNRLVSVRNATEDDWKIVYEPDHFFIASHDRVEVETNTDTLRTETGTHFTATTSVKSYYLQIQIEGAEYIKSASAYISGLAGDITIHNRQLDNDNPVAVYFELNNGKDKARQEKSVAYVTFNTFGKLEDEENLLAMTFEFYTRDGRTVTETIPLTEMFSTEMVRINQWIIIDETIIIEPPEEGKSEEGITPNVGEWDNIEGEIFI